MKWLIWSPAVAILFLAAALPGGLVLLALPLLALGYVLISLIALGGRAEKPAPARVRAVHTHERKEYW
jgi:TRAP-type C4-dicarboxylate transport system permease small subunit